MGRFFDDIDVVQLLREAVKTMEVLAPREEDR